MFELPPFELAADLVLRFPVPPSHETRSRSLVVEGAR